jgi:hypothetical protein
MMLDRLTLRPNCMVPVSCAKQVLISADQGPVRRECFQLIFVFLQPQINIRRGTVIAVYYYDLKFKDLGMDMS